MLQNQVKGLDDTSQGFHKTRGQRNQFKLFKFKQLAIAEVYHEESILYQIGNYKFDPDSIKKLNCTYGLILALPRVYLD